MLESLLSAYGYPILIIGTFLESETVMILAGLAALIWLTHFYRRKIHASA